MQPLRRQAKIQWVMGKVEKNVSQYFGREVLMGRNSNSISLQFCSHLFAFRSKGVEDLRDFTIELININLDFGNEMLNRFLQRNWKSFIRSKGKHSAMDYRGRFQTAGAEDSDKVALRRD
jgi:hypothetical protein